MDFYDSEQMEAGARLTRVEIKMSMDPYSPDSQEFHFNDPVVTTENGSMSIKGVDGWEIVRAPGAWSSVEVKR